MFLMMGLFVASCTKDNDIDSNDNTPDINPPTHTVNKNTISLRGVEMDVENVHMSAAHGFGSNDIISYAISIDYSVLGVPGLAFAMNYNVPTELAPQDGSYTGNQAGTITQAAIDAIEAWIDAGADINDFPVLDDTSYDASNVSITVSNVVLSVVTEMGQLPDPNDPFGSMIDVIDHKDEADVLLSGYLVDSAGNQVPVSGSFAASIVLTRRLLNSNYAA